MSLSRNLIFRIVALFIIDALALELVLGIGSNYSVYLAIGIFVITFIINIIFLFDRFRTWRWISPELALMALLVVYPVAMTIYVSFTNYGDGHLLSKEQAISNFTSQYYNPANAITYKWVAFIAPNAPTPASPDNFILWLTDANGKALVGSASKGLMDAASPDAEATFGKFGEKDANGVPKTIGTFTALSRLQVVSRLKSLQSVQIKTESQLIRITSLDSAAQQAAKYIYDPNKQQLTDNETGKVYREEGGEFVTGEGETRQALQPGWPVTIGLANFTRAFTDPNIRDPFLRVFLWTIAFAISSVFLTFSLGLIFAMVLNAPDLPLRGIFRSILILPYALPAFISALVWTGLLNPIYGPINMTLKNITGISPPWFSDPGLAKAAILIVNLWLGYPYMMLITMGALQSIPGDLYEAAVIDGANARQQFRSITLPLLMVAVAPLLIGSFAFNFNNFAIIELITKGGPPASALTPAGHTDILISYTYRLAFAGSKGIDYGFASAITLFIFAIVAGVTIFNNRLSRNLEKVYTNG